MKPSRVENQTRNGVRVIVRKYEDGSTVDAACQCFGSPRRTHSNDSCPLLREQRRRAA